MDIDITMASPSYERADLNELIRLISQPLKQKRNVIFIDIGASFGKFTVAIGGHFRRYKKQLHILSFEPDSDAYQLLQKNIKKKYCRSLRKSQNGDLLPISCRQKSNTDSPTPRIPIRAGYSHSVIVSPIT